MSTKHGLSRRHEYLKLHVVLDVDRWKIRSVRITKSNEGDTSQMPEILKAVCSVQGVDSVPDDSTPAHSCYIQI